MNTPINEDFDKYKNDFWKGLTFRETMWGAAAVAVGFATMLFFVLYLQWDAMISTFLMMPVVSLIGFNGFYNKNGMMLAQYIRRKWNILFGRPLTIRDEDIRIYKIKSAEQTLLPKKKKESGRRVKAHGNKV